MCGKGGQRHSGLLTTGVTPPPTLSQEEPSSKLSPAAWRQQEGTVLSNQWQREEKQGAGISPKHAGLSPWTGFGSILSQETPGVGALVVSLGQPAAGFSGTPSLPSQGLQVLQ